MIISLKPKKKSKPTLKAGIYNSTVLSVAFRSDYRDETAFVVKYLLTNTSGKTYNFSETFVINYGYERTVQFFDYLEENGISTEHINDFEGCTEKLTLKKNPLSDGRILLSITEREFVAKKAGASNGTQSSQQTH